MNWGRVIKAVLATMMLAEVTREFLSEPGGFDLAVRIQPAATWWFLAVLLATPLLGRFFCEVLCPLGILQSFANKLFHPRRHVRRVCTRLPVSRAQAWVRGGVLAVFAGLLALGFGGLAWAVTPYAIYGKALALFVPGLVLFGGVLALAAFGDGRLWCNWVCPVGTLFTLLAKKSFGAHKVGPGCANCRKCFGASRPDAAAPQDGVTRRETLQGIAVLAAAEAAEKTVDGGYAVVSLPGRPERTRPVLPPGAGDASSLDRLCVACGRCVKACRGGCLVASTALVRFGQPELDFRKGHCLAKCNYACARACPTLALRPLSPRLSRACVRIGHAVWMKDRCIRTTDGVACTACSRKCPVQAIHLVAGIPVVDKDACIGCGACEHVCPSRPLPAIVVQGLERQRIVEPMPKEG